MRDLLAEPEAALPAHTLVMSEPEAPAATPVGMPPAGAMQVNDTLGPYTITGFLGRGGMAMVYAAKDADAAPVALKVMEETPFIPAGILERFRREAEAAKRLRRHPHIVTVYDTGCAENKHYIAMELVSGGRSLERLLAQGPLSVADALHAALGIAGALAYAHDNGIIHRDLKPGNVLMGEFGEPLLADFGLARMEHEQSRNLTLSAVSMGTPRYMSPEQTRSVKRTSHLTDIYSFGVVLYEAITGSLPYDIPADAGMPEMFEIIRVREPRNPRKLRREISRDLAAVLFKLLEKEPERRYQTMADAINDLEACSRRERVSVRVPTVFERVDKILRRHKKAAAAVAILGSVTFCSWKWYEKQLAATREWALPWQAEDLGRSREAEGTAGAGRDAAAEAMELLVARAHKALVEHGDIDAAQSHLVALMEQVQAANMLDAHPGVTSFVRWQLARLSLARGDCATAEKTLGSLAAEYEQALARRLELETDPELQKGMRDVRISFIRFEEGLACSLAGNTERADAVWQRLLADPDLETPLAVLCRGALGQLDPPTLAERARQQLPVMRALAYWLAARQTEDESMRYVWEESAAGAAKTALPWLYYVLKHRTAAIAPGANTEGHTER